MSLDIKYIPLSFITNKEEILTQIRNTVLFSYLLNQFEETPLEYYLDSTQYGFTASASEKGSHQLVRITDINGGSVDWSKVPFCDCDSENKYLLKEKDILVARTGGTTGKSFLVNNPPPNAVFASYLIRLRVKANFEIEFINLFLNSYIFWSQIIEMKAGSAMPNVNAEKLKILRIPKCDLETQQKIIAVYKGINTEGNYTFLFNKIKVVETIFSKNNQLATQLSQQLDLLKQLRQAFLREAMQGQLAPPHKIAIPPLLLFKDGAAPAEGLGAVGRCREVKEVETGQTLLAQIKAEKAQLIKDKKLKPEKPLPPLKIEEIPFEIPENWTWCRLGEICNYGSSPKAEPKDLDNDTWVLDLEDIEKETSKLINKVRFSERNSLSSKSMFKKGQILYSKLRPYLDKVIIADEDGVCTTEILPLEFYGQHNPNFLLYTLKRPDFIDYVNSVTRGMKMPRLGTNEGKMALIPLPPLSEQRRIVEKLEGLMGTCEALEGSIKASQLQNQQLLGQVLREALGQNSQ